MGCTTRGGLMKKHNPHYLEKTLVLETLMGPCPMGLGFSKAVRGVLARKAAIIVQGTEIMWVLYRDVWSLGFRIGV